MNISGVQVNIPAAIVLSVGIAACTALVITGKMTVAVFASLATVFAQAMTNKIFRIPAERAEDKVAKEEVQP